MMGTRLLFAWRLELCRGGLSLKVGRLGRAGRLSKVIFKTHGLFARALEERDW